MLLWKILVLAFIASETLEKPRDSNKSGCISNSHIWNVEKRQKMDMLRFDISSYKAFRGTWDIQHTTNEFQDAIFGMLVLLRYMSAVYYFWYRKTRTYPVYWTIASSTADFKLSQNTQTQQHRSIFVCYFSEKYIYKSPASRNLRCLGTFWR